ncbi:hypothetical protein FHS76_004170 [Ochrobactrum daejeonense]|uniref:Lipoprotein n=1 Tax=Brucella daejeonensis TaxID=659015 RepID=A0A7W9B123_9HYPH|nr:hypothetical protein [Brucella daejeonensis]MBB5704253.1 hypothetical protein [Brucella daejeonensis]
MRLLRASAVGLMGLILSSCVSEGSYNQAQEAMRGSPALKRDGIARCYKGTSRASAASKAHMAKVMNVSSRSNVARIYCTRAFNGIASGRITYTDFRTRSPKFIRVIQGR